MPARGAPVEPGGGHHETTSSHQGSIMRKISAITLAAVSAMTFTLGAAQATTLPYKGFDRLVAESDGIVVATVRQVQFAADAQRGIGTYVTFDDLQVLEGRYDAPTLTLRMKGGRVDNEILFVDGVPQFEPNERVVLFVQGNGRDLVPLVGWSQGLFRLKPGANGETAVTDAAGHPVLAVKGNQVLTQEGADAQGKDVHVMGAPNAAFALHAAAAGQSGAGRTENGSATALVGERIAKGAKPMSADAFLELVKQRSAGRNAQLAQSAASLRSVEIGAPLAALDQRDAPADARAAAMPQVQGAEFAQPALPRRMAAPAAGDKQ
jgi:hypothetical protein